MSVFLSSLKKSGHLDQLHLTICNVGSRKLGSNDDYTSLGWDIFAPRLTIYGFDADVDACDEANADLEARQINWTEKHIPLALGNSVGESTLYVTKHPMCSSLYPPNEPYLARFGGLPELVNLDFTLEIEATTLDAFCQAEGINEIDFLQVDVQGADLQVLEGASEILKRSNLAVQVEVEFSHLYDKQPLFADVDTYLRTKGFTLFDLATSYRTRARSPIRSTVRSGQLLWADAFYFRDLIREDITTPLKTPEQVLKLACIADIMNFPDYALELLEHLTLQYGNDKKYNFADNIVESLAQFPALVQQGLASLPIVASIQDYIRSYDLDSLQVDAISQPQEFISPVGVFHSEHYQRHNQRRLEHLTSLGLDIASATVLEVGAGIGDHTSFFLDRGCQVVSTEARKENLEILASRYPNIQVRHLDLDNPDSTFNELFDIVYCYGLLYHLQNPTEAIEFMSRCCQKMLLLETCVSFGDEEAINPCTEMAESPSQAVSGQGCRPTRKWVYNQLKRYFDFVYMPVTQPNHEEFPIDWTSPPPSNGAFTRSVFIGSRQQLNSQLLIEDIPMKQKRH
ncbi:FkbM family methyltransferase [Trichocoleus sp. Lan]|uniref:FkbM family methyltransferase n=1 Tax=Trichocoleus sp. Lan TaxID=2933927 RepID=UPI00329888F0